ncbi:COX15/CtaA family protein, partial [Vibrio parahaemolyticus]|nr:COX15/CtaA family protein [Vibrio parahaemolyticus]
QTGHDNYEYGVFEYPARMPIHVSHRIGAMVTAVGVLTYCVVLMKQDSHHSQKVGMWRGMALACQITLGSSTGVVQLPS